MADKTYQLVVRKGPRPGQVFPLTLDTITVGRDPLADIVMNDPEVSRHHAQLLQTEIGYEVKDLGSTNGSFVDGKRIGGEPVPLSPGQVVMFGSNVTLIYQATSAADPLATMVAPMGAIPFEAPEEAAVEPDRPDFEQDDLDEVEESPPTTPLSQMDAPEPEEMQPLEPEPVEPEPLPPFDRMHASTEILPQKDFGERGPLATTPESEPLMEANPPRESDPFEIPPPPPPPDKKSGIGGFNNRNLVIAIVVALLLCCCCLLLLSFAASRADWDFQVWANGIQQAFLIGNSGYLT